VAGYKLSSDAKDDLREIRAYYLENAGARVARYVLGEIADAMRFLARTPGAGHSRRDLTGEAVKFWPVFSFLIVYDPATKPIGIARVLHGRRDLETMFQGRPPQA
jgi:antitoxin ParD1/3/4/toxin ParE1/3/4